MRCTFLLPLLLAGCTFAPAHVTPTVALPPAPEAATIASAAGGPQQLRPGASLDARWWQAFGSSELDALVAEALVHNNDLAAADASLHAAQELVRANVGANGPQVDFGYQVERDKTSGALANVLFNDQIYNYNLHTLGVSVSYPLDVFGAGRSRVRSARANAEIAAARLDAARTTTVANLVVAVIQHAALDAAIREAGASLASNRAQLTFLERRRALGEVSAQAVSAQQAELASAEAAVPALTRQKLHQEGLILALIGRPPGGAVPSLPALDTLHLPEVVPVAVPATLVTSRPDMRAADASVRGAAADVGAAVAARLPRFMISGVGGGVSPGFSDILSHNNLFFALVGGVMQPIFHSGELLHREHAARATLDAAMAQYRATALQAFLEVNDALVALHTDAATLDAASRAEKAASRSLQQIGRQQELGAVDSLALLQATAAAASARQQLVAARAARLADTVALYQACGTVPGKEP